MASWKKIVVNGADNVYLTGSFSGSSFHGNGSGLTGITVDESTITMGGVIGGTADVTTFADNVISSSAQIAALDVGIVSGSITSTTQGQITVNDVNVNLQDLGTLDSPTFTNLTVSGDLTVTGTTTQLQITNLNVSDKFILLNSSSSDPDSDGGIIIQTDGSANGTALFYDNSSNRWALAQSSSVAWNNSSATAHQYVVSVSQSAAAPTGTPSDFGTDDASRYGMMYVDTSDTTGGGLYLYLP